MHRRQPVRTGSWTILLAAGAMALLHGEVGGAQPQAGAIAAPAARCACVAVRTIRAEGRAVVTEPAEIVEMSISFGVTLPEGVDAQIAREELSDAVLMAITDAGGEALCVDEEETSSGRTTGQVTGPGEEPVVMLQKWTRFSVTLSNVELTEAVIRAAVEAGASVSGLLFSVADEEALKDRAIREATQRARARAEQFARAAGLAVGGIVRIEPGDAPQLSHRYQQKSYSRENDVEEGFINPGMTGHATSAAVTTEFELIEQDGGDAAFEAFRRKVHDMTEQYRRTPVLNLFPPPQPPGAPLFGDPADLGDIFPDRRGTWRGWELRQPVPDYPGVFFVPSTLAASPTSAPGRR